MSNLQTIGQPPQGYYQTAQPGYNPQQIGEQVPYNYQPVAQGYGPPPGQGYVPPPGQGYVPPPGQGYGASPFPGQGYGAPPPPPGQPTAWMQRPQPITGCPPGLEYLTMIDNLQIEQIPSLLEAFTGWDTNNKYAVKNGSGAQVYYAMEETDTCMRICCAARRSFTMHIVDNFNQEVMRVTREFKCCAGCCWFAGCCDCCSYEVKIEAPAGNVIGYVKQSGSFFKPCYDILDENHVSVLKLEGPCCILDGAFCPCDNEFKLMTLSDGNQIGSLKKVYAGFINEMVTTADRFGINFPIDLSVKVKASLIGAMFLIDFMFFEKPPNNGDS